MSLCFFFSIFQSLDFLGCQGIKVQKWPKMTKNSLLHLIFQEPYIIWSSFMVHMYVQKDNISRHFIHFFKNLIFGIISGVKGQKMAQNDKKFCLSHSVSQELYIIWLWFLVHMCKMTIPPAIFSFFQKIDFFWFLGGKREKMT